MYSTHYTRGSAKAIRQEKEVKGIRIGKKRTKLYLQMTLSSILKNQRYPQKNLLELIKSSASFHSLHQMEPILEVL